MDSATKKLFEWISKSLSIEIPETTVGIHFNFYEAEDSIHIQLFGMSSFEGSNPESFDYWPGDETFSTEENVFYFPIEKLGNGWEEWLKSLLEMINQYIKSGENSALLKKFSAIGAGFVDGDMYLLWCQSDSPNKQLQPNANASAE